MSVQAGDAHPRNETVQYDKKADPNVIHLEVQYRVLNRTYNLTSRL